MKVGDLVNLPPGCSRRWGLPTGIAVLIRKLPRSDRLEYDWQIFADGDIIELGRQIEQSVEVLSESR